MIEVFVESIRVNMANYKRVVMLKEKTGSRFLPIWIGHFEADAIAIPMQNVPITRPLTHDMLVDTIGRLGGRCLDRDGSWLAGFPATALPGLEGDHAGRPSPGRNRLRRRRLPRRCSRAGRTLTTSRSGSPGRRVRLVDAARRRDGGLGHPAVLVAGSGLFRS